VKACGCRATGCVLKRGSAARDSIRDLTHSPQLQRDERLPGTRSASMLRAALHRDQIRGLTCPGGNAAYRSRWLMNAGAGQTKGSRCFSRLVIGGGAVSPDGSSKSAWCFCAAKNREGVSENYASAGAGRAELAHGNPRRSRRSQKNSFRPEQCLMSPPQTRAGVRGKGGIGT